MTQRGEYRPLYAVLIDTPGFQALSKDARLLFYTLKLALGPIGIAVVYDDALEARSGILRGDLGSAREELVDGGWLVVEGRVHWIVNGLKHEPTMSMSNANHRKFVAKLLSGLPRSPIVTRFATRYGVLDLLPEGDAVGDTEGHTQWDTQGHAVGDTQGHSSSGNIPENMASEGHSKGIGDGIPDPSPPHPLPRTSPPPSSSARAREPNGLVELRDLLGIRSDVADTAAEEIVGSRTWPRGVVGLYGPTGTRRHELAGLDEDQIAQVLAESLVVLAGEGGRWSQPFFDAIVRRVAREYRESGDELAGLSPADRRVLLHRRAMESWDLTGSAP